MSRSRCDAVSLQPLRSSRVRNLVVSKQEACSRSDRCAIRRGVAYLKVSILIIAVAASHAQTPRNPSTKTLTCNVLSNPSRQQGISVVPIRKYISSEERFTLPVSTLLKLNCTIYDRTIWRNNQRGVMHRSTETLQYSTLQSNKQQRFPSNVNSFPVPTIFCSTNLVSFDENLEFAVATHV